LAELATLGPAIVVLSNTSYSDSELGLASPSSWRDGVDRTLRALAAAVVVIVIRDVPKPGFDVPTCLARVTWRTAAEVRGQCQFPRDSDDSLQARHEREVVARYPFARFVEVADLICPESRCDPVRGGVVIYRDDHHLTATFAAGMAGEVDAKVTQALLDVAATRR
jgi:hypothetical protein